MFRSFVSSALVAGGAIAFVAGISPASAVTYNIDVDGCSGGCGLSNYGTINVTGSTTDLHVVVSLVATAQLHSNSSPVQHTLVFNLAHTGAVGFSTTSNTPVLDLTPPHTEGWVFNSLGAGAYSTPSLGNYNFAIQCSSGEAGNVCGSTLDFHLTGTGLALSSTLAGLKNIFFALDIANSTTNGVKTGIVGATACDDCAASPPSVPVPGAAWLMGSVLGGAGFTAWRRRRRVKAA